MMKKRETMFEKHKKRMMKKKREEDMKRKKEKQCEKKSWNLDGIEFHTVVSIAEYLETTPAKLKSLKKKYGSYELAALKYKENLDMNTEGLKEGRLIRGEVIYFEGKPFLNFSVLCEHYEVNCSTVHARMKKGMSLADALKRPVRGKKKEKTRLKNGEEVYIIGEERYESLRDLLEGKGLTYNKLRKLNKEHGSYEAAVKEHERAKTDKARKPVVRKGGVMAFDKHHGNLKAVADFHEVAYQSLRYRLKKGMPIDEAIKQMKEKKKKRDSL